MLLVASSPYAKRGALYEAHREHYGKNGDSVLVWQAPTHTMNPTINQSIIDEAIAKDPASAAAEWLGQFRNDIESFISREAVEACISEGIRERAPEQGIAYSAFIDPAGGSGKDSFTLAIAHKDKKTGMGVLDCIREVKPPFGPEQVVQDFAATLKSYGINKALSDKFAGAFPVEASSATASRSNSLPNRNQICTAISFRCSIQSASTYSTIRDSSPSFHRWNAAPHAAARTASIMRPARTMTSPTWSQARSPIFT
jgi:hypothetical protein